MKQCSSDIKDMLVDGLGYIYATNLYVSREPAKPDNCVTIYDTGGSAPQPTLPSGDSYHTDSFQIRVRNLSFDQAMEKAYEIYYHLHGSSQITRNGTYYGSVLAQTPPQQLKWDDGNRVIVIINFQTQRRKGN